MKMLPKIIVWLAMFGIATAAFGQTNLNFAQVLERAQHGDEEAQFRLGRFYIDGYFNGGTNAFANVPDAMPDFAQARKWLTPLAEKGEPRAQNSLGHMALNGLGGETNLVAAREWFAKANGGGNYKAARNLAIMYRHGHGGPKDLAKAEELVALSYKRVREVVKQGDPDDEYSLGVSLFFKRTVGEPGEGLALIRKAAGQGLPLAEHWLSTTSLKPTKEMAALRLSAANKGLPVAQATYGSLLLTPDKSIRNEKEGFKWLKLGAERGHVGGQYNLGVAYTIGRVVERDRAEAFKWFLKSAQGGNVPGEFEVGNCLRHGYGVEKDLKAAAEWLRKGVDKGFPRSQYRLAEMYEKGAGVKRDRVEAYKLYWLAAAGPRKLGIKQRDALKAKLHPKQLADAEKRIKAYQDKFKSEEAEEEP